MASASAYATVARASKKLEEDEKKNAAQFASDESFLAALVAVLGDKALSLEERDVAAIVVRTLAKRSVPWARISKLKILAF